MASYRIVKSFGTLTRHYREGNEVELTAADAKSYVKLGWLEPIKVVKKREPKKDSRANG